MPTGENFYGFNRSRVPSAAVFVKVAALADSLAHDYRERHGPALQPLEQETLRHEGIIESQVLGATRRPCADRPRRR